MIRKKMFFIIFLVFLVIPLLVSSDGICELDKFDYHPGEIVFFSCSCDSAAEENKAGYIVFLNSSGDILQNNSADSGSCTTSFFSDNYVLPAAITNYTGNVTFSLTGNGSGTPINWGNAGDITSDDYNVTGAQIVDCLIIDVTALENFNLGELGSVKISVVDANTMNPLVGVNCQAEGYDILSRPILFEPYGPGKTFRVSGSGGEVGFQHVLSEASWSVNTNYLFEFHCHCTANNSIDSPCYDEVLGVSVGFKSCNTKSSFVTSGVDNRDVSKSILPIVIGILVMSAFFIVSGFLAPKNKIGLKIAGVGVGVIELVILSFIMYVNHLGQSIVSVLRINFYVLLILGFGFGFMGLILFMLRMMNIGDRLDSDKEVKGEDEVVDKKWGKK